MVNRNTSPSDTWFFRGLDWTPSPVANARKKTSWIVAITPSSTNDILLSIREEDYHGKPATLDMLENRKFNPSDPTVFSRWQEAIKSWLREYIQGNARVVVKNWAIHLTYEVYLKVLAAMRANPKLVFPE